MKYQDTLRERATDWNWNHWGCHLFSLLDVCAENPVWRCAL